MTAVINYLNPPVENLHSYDLDEGFTNDLPLQEFKYKKLEDVIDHIPYKVVPILNKMLSYLDEERDSKTLIDYKVRDLKKGDCGCSIRGWHLDCVRNPNHNSKPETHLIFSTHFGTEFITTPMKFRKEDEDFKSVLEANSDFDFIFVKSNSITKYNRFNLHRGPIIKVPCRRLLIRITKTQVIK